MSAEALRYPSKVQFTPTLSPYSNDFMSPFQPKHSAVNEIFENKTTNPFNSDIANAKTTPFNDEFLNNGEFKADLSAIERIQVIFNKELGITKQNKLNYNPVLARWKFENLQSPADIEQFKKYELWQIQTALYERNQVEKNSVNYTIGEDGEIYNELFPDEPFRNVLLRGLAYQKEHGSVDLEREQAEFDGWEQICELLKNPNTPEHTSAIIISGPSSAKESPYQHNFIDAYRLHKDPISKKRFIKMTRTNSNLSYEAYEQIAKHFEPDYFHELDGPIDAWFLGKPIYRHPEVDSRTVSEIIEQNFGIIDDVENAKIKLELWKQVEVVAKHFLDEGICKGNFDPQEIAKKWNVLLVKNDIVWDKLKNKKTENETTKIHSKKFENIHEEIAWLNTKEVRSIAAACGASAGFKLNQNNATFGINSPFNSVMKNSVAQFGLDKDEYGSLEFDCPECLANNRYAKNIRPYGKLIEKCQHCGSTEVACKEEEQKAENQQSKVKEIEKPKETGSRIFVFPRKDESKKRAA